MRIRVRRKGPQGLAGERGVALTEFALILPVLVLVLAGILDFGRILFYWLDANRLAGETARFAVVDQNPFSPLTLQGRIYCSAPSGMQEDLRVSIGPAAPTVGDPVEVVVQKDFRPIAILGLGTVPIKASATMRLERFAVGTSVTAFKPADDIDASSNVNVPACP